MPPRKRLVFGDVLVPPHAPTLPLDPMTARTTRARVYRRTDTLIATARVLGASVDSHKRYAVREEILHAYALVALREAANAYTRHRSDKTRARVLLASLRLGSVTSPAYTRRMAALVEPALHALEDGGMFKGAMAARRRAASVELVSTAWRATSLCSAPLVSTAWRDLTRLQRGRLEAAYGAHYRGSTLWRLRMALQPHREHRPRDTARRIAQVTREVLEPADPELASFIRRYAFAQPDDPPLRDPILGIPALLDHMPSQGRTDCAMYALTHAVERVRE